MFSVNSGLHDALSTKSNALLDSIRLGRDRAVPWLDRATARITTEVPVLEAMLSRIDPTLSLRRTLARVVAVRDETPDVKTFVLKPNARFGSHVPGSFVRLHLTIGGRRVQRSYSLSSAPSQDGLVAITVKRVPGGLVSNFLADSVVPGDVLELGAPEGWFVLTDRPAPALLMISAGSGITPVMSMLRHLVAQRANCAVTFLHFARTPADIVFRRELEEIAGRVPNVRIVSSVETADREWSGPCGRFTEQLLESTEPDFRNADTYLCGPPGFMQVVMQTFERAGADLSKLRYERFSTDLDTSLLLDSAQVVRFLRSGTETLASGQRTILEEAESRGVRPTFGCRAGTCGTCRCLKKKGVVVNLATGKESSEGEEMIFPCVSVARSTIEVDL